MLNKSFVIGSGGRLNGLLPEPKKMSDMEISTERLLSLIKASAQLGAAEINNIHLPGSDNLSRAEAIRHLSRNGVKYPEKWLKHNEAEGVIHRHKHGERNSKVTYSLVEIQRVIVMNTLYL